MLSILLAVAVCVGDRLFKKWVVANIALGAKLNLIDGLIHLTYLQNTGAAFSMLRDHPEFLTVFTSVLALLLLIAIFRLKLSKAEKLCLGAVLGGAVGNILDRATLGYVVDMFEVEFMNFAVFNVGDCFIVCGGILFCILYFIDIVKEEKQKKENGDAI